MKKILVFAVMLTLMMGSQAIASPPEQDGLGAYIRLIHASPGAEAVQVVVDGQVTRSHVAYADVTGYRWASYGQYEVKVLPADSLLDTPPLIETNFGLANQGHYTVMFIGPPQAIETWLLPDDDQAPPAGKARLRFVHASPTAPAVDLRATDGTLLFSNVGYKQGGFYQTFNPGTFDLEIVLAGTDTVLLPIPAMTFEADQIYTVFVVGSVGGNPALEVLTTIDYPLMVDQFTPPETLNVAPDPIAEPNYNSQSQPVYTPPSGYQCGPPQCAPRYRHFHDNYLRPYSNDGVYRRYYGPR